MADKNLESLFYDGLKDIYYAERKILKALPKMARGASTDELRQAFEKHKEETEGQVERLQQVFEIFGKRAQGKTCPAIDGILEEGEEVLDEYKGTPALDAGLVAAAQAVEHYEIARYGTLKRWAADARPAAGGRPPRRDAAAGIGDRRGAEQARRRRRERPRRGLTSARDGRRRSAARHQRPAADFLWRAFFRRPKRTVPPGAEPSAAQPARWRPPPHV